MNDLEDISNIHQVLSNLKVLDGMTEMPVFDVQEPSVSWSGQRGSVANPFEFYWRIPRNTEGVDSFRNS